MSFLAPMAFWFAAAIPVVIVFYLLKRKRVVYLVSSTILWQRFIEDMQASAPFQKLRHNWLLILQILVLIIAILALSRPYIAGDVREGRLTVVVLDGSASMKSADVKPSRFGMAQEAAMKLVEGLDGRDQMVVLQAGANTEVKQSPASEKNTLRRGIQSAVAGDTPTRLREALKLAETLVQNRTDAIIHVFSDGAADELSEFENSNLPLMYHRVGESSRNAGITTLDVRPNPENPSQRAVFLTVYNSSADPIATGVELLFGDVLLEAKQVQVAAGQTEPVVFVTDQVTDGIFKVRLTYEDDLAVDNEASVVSLLPQPVRVILVTPGNRLLSKAVQATPRTELTVAADLTDSAADADLVILDRVIPTVWPESNVLAFNVGNTNWFGQWADLEGPPIVYTKATHPALRFVSFDNVLIGRSLAVETPPWAVSLVESPQHALIVAGDYGPQRILWVGFDVLETTWPLRLSFPIFMQNALEWLNPATAAAELLTVKAGEPFRINMPGAYESAEVLTPSGAKRQIKVASERGELVFADTIEQGIYQVSAGTNSFVFCVNLLDGAESNIQPKSELNFGEYAKAQEAPVKEANFELWRWVLLAALGLLMFEWWYYHRRTA